MVPGGQRGYRGGMTDEERRHPTIDQPLNAPAKRPLWQPILAVALLLVVVAVIFLLVTWVQQNS